MKINIREQAKQTRNVRVLFIRFHTFNFAFKIMTVFDLTKNQHWTETDIHNSTAMYRVPILKAKVLFENTSSEVLLVNDCLSAMDYCTLNDHKQKSVSCKCPNGFTCIICLFTYSHVFKKNDIAYVKLYSLHRHQHPMWRRSEHMIQILGRRKTWCRQSISC